MSVSIGMRTTFGREFRGQQQAVLPKTFPYRADLVTLRDGDWQHEIVEVIGGNARRFRIRALRPTVMPGLTSPLPKGVSMIVPGYSLQLPDHRLAP